MTADSLVSEAISRIVALRPNIAMKIRAWEAANRARLLIWATYLLAFVAKPSKREPNDLIAAIIARAESTQPAEAAWLIRYREVMTLFAGLAIKSARDQRLLATEITAPRARMEANILAARIALQEGDVSPEKRILLLQYSGFGGLSLDVLEGLPVEYFPSPKSLLDEYFTPLAVTREIVRTVARIATGPLEGKALEPAAGIGRLLLAAEGNPAFGGLSWTAVEFSTLTAAILRKVFPSVAVYNEAFESFIQREYESLAGQVAFAFTNPPFGVRGANKTLDRDKEYREDIAYVYFARRTLDLLKPGGIGVLIAPQGLITGDRMRKTREKLLRRHHLLLSFRLPSSIYPGAEIVTDCSFWLSRGGELAEVGEEDEYVLDGGYYRKHPAHILGREETSKRGRYTVSGEFTGFPNPDVRAICSSCAAITPFVVKRPANAEPIDSALVAYVELSARVSRYQELRNGAPADRAKASALHPELVAAILARMETPDALPMGQLRKHARNHPSLGSLAAILDQNGGLRPEFAQPPNIDDDYQGFDTAVGLAEHIYAKSRKLELSVLKARVGESATREVERQLLAQGWCQEQIEGETIYYPQDDYYSGDLWQRLDRISFRTDEIATRQTARLRNLIGTFTLEDASPTLRDPWIPSVILTDFLRSHTDSDVPLLVWEGALLLPRGSRYSDSANWPVSKDVLTAIGYANHDLSLFDVEYDKALNPETGAIETAQEAIDKARLAYGKAINSAFRQYLEQNPEKLEIVLDTYGRTFRGYLPRSYPPDPMPIARWGASVRPRPHQLSAAWRVVYNNGGLLAHDVGVGKTLTSLTSVAYLRQLGRARRPLIVVPNSIVWKWFKEIARALPDYRVLVVGSTRYTGRGGALKSRIDDAAERRRKWTEFQLGLYDLAIVTYSVWGAFSFSEPTVRSYAESTPALLREIGFQAAKTADELKNIRKLLIGVNKARSDLAEKQNRLARSRPEEIDQAARSARDAENRLNKLLARSERLVSLRDKLQAITNESERQRAQFDESLGEWVAETVENNGESEVPFESLGVDFLVVDEAHNYKNLWSVGRREGGVPKYLGAIAEGSRRAKTLSIAAFVVQRFVGGSGVLLLSATPAKNSPLEFFTLLGYVDHNSWSRLGILDAEYFVDRYLRIELKAVLKPDGNIAQQSAVTGFMNLIELRAIVNRFGDFKTAKEVGLLLPKVAANTELLPMGDEQTQLYRALRSDYEEILMGPNANKSQALGILARMGLVALHPDLYSPPDGGWSWASAGRARIQPSRKMVRAAEIIESAKSCNAIIFVENVAMHRWMQDFLVSRGFDAKSIAILNAERTPTAQERQEIAEGFNGTPAIVDPVTGVMEQEGIPPRYRIVIANSIANEGIDLQVHTCIVIHLDFPFEPATLQQRNGRAVRQFNTNSVVGVYYLASDKSYDGIKLALIKGKLRWQDDLINGTERETNNPSAALDLSVEDLLLMLADDPVSARAALDKIKEKAEAENRLRIQAAAWNSLGAIAQIVRSATFAESEDRRERYRQEALKRADFLYKVNPDVWPWLPLLERVMSGIRCTLVPVPGPNGESQRLVWSDLMLEQAGQALVIGISSYGSPVYRGLGSFQWQTTRNEAAFWAPLANLPLSSYQTATDDSGVWEPKMLAAMTSAGRLADLGLENAPDEWRSAIWARFGERIIRSLPSYASVPVREGDTVALVSPRSIASVADVLPPNQEGWDEFLKRVVRGQWSAPPLEAVGSEWFFRQFPARLADDREIVKYNDKAMRLVARIGRVNVVVEDDGYGYYLGWANSSELIPTLPFSWLDSARTAARFLSSRWPDEKIHLDENMSSALRFAAGQATLTLEQLANHMGAE